MTLTTWATPVPGVKFGPALARKDAAKPPAEKGGDLDHCAFPARSLPAEEAGSVCVKSGEQQSIGIARLCFSSAAFTFFRNVSSPSKKPE